MDSIMMKVRLLGSPVVTGSSSPVVVSDLLWSSVLTSRISTVSRISNTININCLQT